MRPPGGQIPGVSMTSADGIHWVNRVTSGRTGDRSTMFYNPLRKKWVYSLRSSFRGRSRHYWECDDFLKGAAWSDSDPVVWTAADNKDLVDPETKQTPQLYNLDSSSTPGTLLTRPLTFSGSQLFVNTSAANGNLRVEIQDQSGTVIPPYTLENCQAVTFDSTLAQVSWKGAQSLDAIKGKVIRFQFTLTNASIYAFWVSRDNSGRSDGYVAGGGPGYTGMTDTVGKAALKAAAPLGWD